MRNISLIPYECGAGACNKFCADGPGFLQKIGLTKLLAKQNIEAKWQGLRPKVTSNNNIEIVAAHCAGLRDNVSDILQSGGLPITIGGDHSMAIGTWTGVADSLHVARKLGLIWLDAHMDAHTVISSHTKNYHGMPVSYLLGKGNDILSAICKNAPVIMPYNMCFIGIRSFEPEEAALLQNMGITVFTIQQVRQIGLAEVLQKAMKIVTNNTAGFGISVDIDVFDPKIAPGTGTREEKGLFKDEFIKAMQSQLLGYKNRLLALEIAEYNPHLDKNNITAQLVADVIAAVVGLPGSNSF